MQKIKDSWRIVNHRDIVPTVPRLMGYCHVAQPIYLSTGALSDVIVCPYTSPLPSSHTYMIFLLVCSSLNSRSRLELEPSLLSGSKFGARL